MWIMLDFNAGLKPRPISDDLSLSLSELADLHR